MLNNWVTFTDFDFTVILALNTYRSWALELCYSCHLAIRYL